MKTKNALKEFKKRLAQSGINPEKDSPLDCIAEMISYYKEIRFMDVDTGEDGDVLLYQYGGSYCWKPGFFDLNITRQFITKKGKLKQLSLSFFYPLSQKEIDGNLWCKCLDDVDTFWNDIKSDQAIAWIEGRCQEDYELEYSDV